VRLTVAIPTFDRNALLQENVSRLLPQLTPECTLLLLDNCSPTPVAETLGDLLAAYPAVPVRIVRHATNVGGNANVLRCFELCETEWVWVLGDDDRLRPDAVATILRDVASHPEVAFFNYATALCPRERVSETRGAVDFAARMDSFSNVLFLSTSVFRARAIRDRLAFANMYAYSNAPHLVALLAALGEDGRCVLSSDRIVDWEPPPRERQWSMVNAALGFPTLLDAPLGPDVRQLLAAKLAAAEPPLEGLVRQLLFMARHDGDGRNARYYYAQIRARRFYGPRRFAARLRALAYAPLLVAPGLAGRVVELVARLALGRRAAENRLQSRTDRL
jgi:glycosyltransferase involved in cell wall biosynthesis